MTQMSSRQSRDNQDEVLGKYGCAVFILAAVLFAVQRFILFSWLAYQSSLGRAFAPSPTEFLFGNPPYTFTDILLGLEFPDEGLLYLLQPHNLAIAVTQAALFAINIALVYLPFFLFIRARTSPRHRLSLRAAGFLFALAIPLSIAVLTATFLVGPLLHDGGAAPATPTPPIVTPAPTSESATYTQYANADLGFSADYPAGWSFHVSRNRDPLTDELLEGHMVVFKPPDLDTGSQRGIGVMVFPSEGGVRLPAEQLPTHDEYVDFVTHWTDTMPVAITGEPSAIQIDGYQAVEFITSGTGVYEPYSLIANCALLVVEDRTFYIDVGGEANTQDHMRRIYEHFIATFDVLPLP